MRRANELLMASEAKLRALYASLEAKVAERTADLAANRARLSDLLTIPDLGHFMTRGPDGTIRFRSERYARLYGWTAQEAVGRNSNELLGTVSPVPPSDIGPPSPAPGARPAPPGTGRPRSPGHGKDVASARRGSYGGAVLEAITAITGSRNAERERQQADALLRGIAAAVPGLISNKDRQGRLMLRNAPVLALVGKRWEKVAGRTNLEILDDKLQQEAVMANDRRVMETGITNELEELVGSDGRRPRVWLATKTPLRGVEVRVEGHVGVSVELGVR